MQNKPNLLNAQMNVSTIKTMNYEQITMNNANKNKPNTNPTCRGVASGEAGSNPISVQKARIFANFLPLFTHFCLTYLNICTFARAF